MKTVHQCLAIAAAMILYAIAAATGLISEEAFEIGFYGLLAAAIVSSSGSKSCSGMAR
ncbi:MAG TPA: hypothetical protein VFO42_00830 [Sphingomicrobium sp.]|nr:hypothetical protein [Sphingomicrobium sp.]